MDKKQSSIKVYEILLIFIHSLYTFIEIFHNILIYVRTKIINCCHEVFGRNIKCVDSKFRSLNKIPQHVAVILGPEEPSFKDLVNIVIWCTASGIPFISFYDHNGKYKILFFIVLLFIILSFTFLILMTRFLCIC